jgi:hypothetical protein
MTPVMAAAAAAAAAAAVLVAVAAYLQEVAVRVRATCNSCSHSYLSLCCVTNVHIPTVHRSVHGTFNIPVKAVQLMPG